MHYALSIGLAKEFPMSNALTTFDFNTQSIRVVEIAGKPWFVAADVCRTLELSDVRMALKPLDASEVTLKRIEGQRGLPMNVISESGVYALIMRLSKPEAKQFRLWVTQVVLPAIRKDGGYIKGEENVKTPEDEDALVLRAMEVMQRKIKRLSEENTKLTIENQDMREELTIVTVDEYRSRNLVKREVSGTPSTASRTSASDW